ncbi:MAG: peptidoglycan-associated lipoprotein Pal [Candidatus Krumholzibacteria bacterium]|nr:peptidoglycan-associated lipoprotein Pal [Candidatus Krumholzibacteria bacterium]
MIVKKLLIVALVLALGVSVFGCGGKKAVDEPTTDMTEPPEVEQIEEQPVKKEPPAAKEIVDAKLNAVFFAFDKYNLTAESRQILEKNASELKQAKDANVIIEGHCDERGTKEYNLALGEKRARAARDYLVSMGVAASRLTVVSYGKERPFDSGHSEAAWAKNRRAHLVVKK